MWIDCLWIVQAFGLVSLLHLNLKGMSCPYCYAVVAAKRSHEAADRWEAEGLFCLAGPHRHNGLEFDRMVVQEKACTCGQLISVSKWLKKILDR